MQSVVLETSLGDIQLELYWNHAPRVNAGTILPRTLVLTDRYRLARILRNLPSKDITMV